MTKDFSTEQPPTGRWRPGWYPDHDRGGERWWDGQDWDRARWRPHPDDGDHGVPDGDAGPEPLLRRSRTRPL